MGWYFQNYSREYEGSVAEVFYGTLCNDGLYRRGGVEVQVAVKALVERTEFYAVVRWRNAGEDWHPWHVDVRMVRFQGHEMGYKPMGEIMGPTINRAPLKVLKAAERLCPLPPSPTSDAYIILLAAYVAAKEAGHRDDAWEMYKELGKLDPDHTARMWRAACWARHEKAGPKVKAGDVLLFATPITFENGWVRDTFVVDYVSMDGTSVGLFDVEYGDMQYRIKNWRQLPYEITERRETRRTKRWQDNRAKQKATIAEYAARGAKAYFRKGFLYVEEPTVAV